MTSRQITSLLRFLVIIVVAGTPLIFWRASGDAFDVVKATWLGCGALAIGVGLLMLFSVGHRRIAPRMGLIATGVFTLGLLITSATSMAPIQSLIGQNLRYTGLVTLFGAILVMLAISSAFNEKQLFTLAWTLVIAACGVALYGFLQEIERDPFAWSSGAFGKFVFGTMGNPNTGSGYVAVLAPVTAWLMLSRHHSGRMRALGGVAFGLSLGMLAAFQALQGYVAFGFGAVYIGFWAWQGGRSFGQWLIVLGTALALMVALSQEGTSTIWILVIGYGAVFALIGWHVPAISEFRLPRMFGRSKTPLLGTGVVAGALIGIFAGPKGFDLLRRELAASMAERGDFYRAAWAVFRDHPIFGSGLETFGLVFPFYRPASHAILLESSRSTSVHSVQLGMFANGGLVLGLSYLALVASVIFLGVRALRKDVHTGSGLLMAVMIAYIGYQVQSSVSVEHVALHLLHFTLAGMIFAFALSTVAAPSRSQQKDHRNRTGRRRNPKVPLVVVVAGTVAWLFASFFVIARPLRASVAALSAVAATELLGDVDTGLRESDRAVNLAPWEGVWWFQRAKLKDFTGDSAGAADDASRAASELGYVLGSTGALARLVLADGRILVDLNDPVGAEPRLQRALEIVRIGAAKDPNAPRVQAETAEVIMEVAEVYFAIGDRESALGLAGEALTYDSSNEAARLLLETSSLNGATEGQD
jgi:O-antigen ligase